MSIIKVFRVLVDGLWGPAVYLVVAVISAHLTAGYNWTATCSYSGLPAGYYHHHLTMALPTSESTTSRVYDSFDIDNTPPHPGSTWTRFVCISDTHSREYEVPPGDVLLHSGDLSSWGEPKQLEKTLKWLDKLPHPTKMYVRHSTDGSGGSKLC